MIWRWWTERIIRRKPKMFRGRTKYFDNISLDLIYGVPGMSNEKWKQNIEKAFFWCTTLELCFDGRKRPWVKWFKLENGSAKDDVAQEHFMILLDTLESNGFIHYEFQFWQTELLFKNNSAYWLGKNTWVLDLRRTVNGISRNWNVSNNIIYLKSIQEENYQMK
jgi:oxygen-independent coproporphyrinogen-3 oxidase